MKKIIAAASLLLTTAGISSAQTTATDWTATDCNGTSHNLYSELDSGKVIVLAWVMPCGSCVGPSTTAFNAVQTAVATHPGKVRFYMADDLGDASCSSLSSWVTSSSIGATTDMTIFSNAGNVISEADYGGTGMPHIVVMGGSAHKIFFNKKNSASNDPTGITNAINSAIGATAIGEINKVPFTIAPNPASNNMTITCARAIEQVVIIAADGTVAKQINYPKGKLNPQVDLSSLAGGIYTIKVQDADNNTGIQKVIKQ